MRTAERVVLATVIPVLMNRNNTYRTARWTLCPTNHHEVCVSECNMEHYKQSLSLSLVGNVEQIA